MSTKRPVLVHSTVIESNRHLSIRLSLIMQRAPKTSLPSSEVSNAARPYESIKMLSGKSFQIKICFFGASHRQFLQKSYESDAFGNFDIRLSSEGWKTPLKSVEIYETQTHPGLELLLGSFIPLKVKTPKHIVVTDFDRTLVDTRYSSFSEMIRSLRMPISHFPAVTPSLERLKSYINEGHIPFIVSASPHFYEKAIRDWLYQQSIYTSSIFLKDYRKIFSIIEGDLTPKDLNTQGFYKLNHLVNIILMTGVPDRLVLMGDGFESDMLIYLTLTAILVGKKDPWIVWNQIKKEKSFRLTTKQHFRFLSKFYQLGPLAKAKTNLQLEIFIRMPKDSLDEDRPKILPFLAEFSEHVTFFKA